MPQRFGPAAVAALLLVLATLSSRAASFDCAKAHSVVETTICASPRLSRLDDELARWYELTSSITVDPKGLVTLQREWLRGTRDECGDDTECLEHAMLVRIERLRWSPESGVKLFADQPPPSSIFGRYSETEPVCVYTGKGDEMECAGEAESYFDLTPGKGNRVHVRSELTFFNGHMCDFEAEGEWADDELRVPSELDDWGCVLILRFRDGKLVTDDPGTSCKERYCGMRGGYAYIELPKLPDAEAKAKRDAAAKAP
ncbi:MAG: hypothetical protein WC538_16920 [Thermoanaerobaculia bacterium]